MSKLSELSDCERRQILRMIENYKAQARIALNACKKMRGNNKTRLHRLKNIEAAAACTWLAVGALRYEESLNDHGVRV
ncbi:MAG: hypothetical protein PHY54_18565 [Methylococcales bacterium]|nr:hypothetical protein [Methylococcales bacterium]